jgi:hypothetical protein
MRYLDLGSPGRLEMPPLLLKHLVPVQRCSNDAKLFLHQHLLVVSQLDESPDLIEAEYKAIRYDRRANPNHPG